MRKSSWVPRFPASRPGSDIGEATRVLLRRVPWKVLVHSLSDEDHLGHLYQLAEEKGKAALHSVNEGVGQILIYQFPVKGRPMELAGADDVLSVKGAAQQAGHRGVQAGRLTASAPASGLVTGIW